MSNLIDENELVSFINICEKYWETFTVNNEVTIQESLEEFSNLVSSKAEKEGYKTLNFEIMSLLIVKYRRLIKTTIEKKKS